MNRTGALRVGLGVVDQAVSSGTNILVVLAAAHFLSPDEFGAFSIVYTLLSVLIAINRSLVAQPTLLLVASESFNSHRLTACMLSSAILSLPFAVAMGAGLGALTGDWLGGAVVALCIPVVLMQDTGRFVLIAYRRQSLVIWSDLLWLALLIMSFAVLSGEVGASGFQVYTLVWLLAGALSLGPFLPRMTRRAFAWAYVRESLTSVRGLGWRMVVETLAINGLSQVIFLAVGGLISVAAVGSLRGAFSVFGPLNVLGGAGAVALLPEMRRWAQSGRVLPCLLAAGGLTGSLLLALGLWSALLLSPTGAKVFDFLGQTGAGIASVAGTIALRYIGTAVVTGAATYLRAFGSVHLSMVLQLVLGGLQAVAAVAAAWWGDLSDVLTVMVAGEAAMAVAYAAAVFLHARGMAAGRAPVMSKWTGDVDAVSVLAREGPGGGRTRDTGAASG